MREEKQIITIGGIGLTIVDLSGGSVFVTSWCGEG